MRQQDARLFKNFAHGAHAQRRRARLGVSRRVGQTHIRIRRILLSAGEGVKAAEEFERRCAFDPKDLRVVRAAQQNYCRGIARCLPQPRTLAAEA